MKLEGWPLLPAKVNADHLAVRELEEKVELSFDLGHLGWGRFGGRVWERSNGCGGLGFEGVRNQARSSRV